MIFTCTLNPSLDYYLESDKNLTPGKMNRSQLEYYEAGETVTVEVQTANNGTYEAEELEVTLQEGSGEEPQEEEETEELPEEEIPEEDKEEWQEFDQMPFFDNGLF